MIRVFYKCHIFFPRLFTFINTYIINTFKKFGSYYALKSRLCLKHLHFATLIITCLGV